MPHSLSFAIIILPIATGMQFIFSSEEMHAILTHPEIKEIVEWTPHGRSWRIVKQRAFENDILPKYFEHSKMTSFVRQVNGWGFRRLSKSNEYYHEFFLRSMPWLVKKMRRPRVSEKKHIDAELEPDFYAISRQFPVPNNRPTREVRALHKVIGEGAKARMPVVWDVDTPPASPSPALPDPAVPAPQGVANHFAAGFMAAQAYHSNQARNARNELEAALVARIQPPQPQPLGNVTDLLLQRADAVQTARNDLQRAQNELLLQEVAASERERALQLLQRPNQMAGNNLRLQEAAAALINSQPSSLTEQASLQRLQQPTIQTARSNLQMAQDDLRLREVAATALINSQPNAALSEQASLQHLQELQRAQNNLRLQEASAVLDNSQPSTLSEQELLQRLQQLQQFERG